MAAAESLKVVHDVGSNVQDTLKAVEDRIRGVEGVLQGVGDRLQGVDDRVKDIGVKVINSAQTDPFELPLRPPLFIQPGAEKSALQIPDAFGAVAAEGAHGADDKVRRVHRTQEGVRDRAIDVNDIRNTVQDIRVIDGAQVIPDPTNHSCHSEPIIWLDAEAITPPISGDLVDSSRQ